MESQHRHTVEAENVAGVIPVAGDVYMPTSVDGRREADKKFGYIHPCVTFPLSDLTMEVPTVR